MNTVLSFRGVPFYVYTCLAFIYWDHDITCDKNSVLQL